MLYSKPKHKKNNRSRAHDFSAEVKEREYKNARMTCRICGERRITQYHHITEKGMGAGRGLGLQINCLGVCDSCHDHNNSAFLHQCDCILERRINETFADMPYTLQEVADVLKDDVDMVIHQARQKFLKTAFMTFEGKEGYYATKEDIRMWLMPGKVRRG